MYLTISTSTNAQSRTVRLAQAVYEKVSELSESSRFLDLADFDLPIDNGLKCDHPHVEEIRQNIGEAGGIVFVMPIYHGDVSVATRNLAQLCGSAMRRKVLGLVSVAGESRSHAASVGFASSLMLEQHSFVVPDFVFAESSSLAGGTIDDRIASKISRLASCLVRVTEALKQA